MEINEQAKALLLGKVCNNCIYLNREILNPSQIEYTQIDQYHQKIQPHSLILKFNCNRQQTDVIKDPRGYTCDMWEENPIHNDQYSIALENLHN